MRIKSVVSVLVAVAAGLSMSSCDDALKVSSLLEAGKETSVTMGVSIAPVQSNSEASITKSAMGAVSNVYGSEDEGFCITEYVSDIDAAPLRTKGWEITSSNISAEYGELDVTAWLMPEAAAGATSAPEQHFSQSLVFDGTASTGSWGWSGEAPMWIIDTPLSIWSYAPATIPGDVKPTVNTSVTDATGNLFPKLNSFSYTVPADFEAQKDLLFAYNVEARNFKETDTGYVVDPNNGTGTKHNGKFDSKFDVRFYHALAAVKFVLAPEEGTSGLSAGTKTISKNTNVRKITLSGVLDSGTCEVSGSGTGAGTVSFVWTPGSTTKDFVYEYDESDPKLLGRRGGSTGFCSAEDGVLFMIPQNLSHVTVTVEFMKYNNPSSTVTRTRSISTSKWEAGKYYVYELAGEIHVPGEMLVGNADLTLTKFKDSPNQKLIKSGDVNIKGVKKIGVVMDGYRFKDNGAATMLLLLAPEGVVPSDPATDIIATPASDFQYNFQTTDMPKNATAADLQQIWHFAGDNTTETYHDYYSFEYQKKITDTNDGITTTSYYVFDTEGNDIFNIAGVCTSENNSAEFTAHIRGIIVLEVEND